MAGAVHNSPSDSELYSSPAETDRLLASTQQREQTLPDRRNSLSLSRWLVRLSLFLVATSVAVTILVSVLRHRPYPRIQERRRHRSQTSPGVSSPFPSNTFRIDDKANGEKQEEWRYTATQFISLTINTLGGLAKRGECDGRSVDPNSGTCYLGSRNITQDVYRRAELLAAALRRLRDDVFEDEPQVDRSSAVLKIVMMPEFYWRGPVGAYDISTMFDSDDDSKDGVLIRLADRVREVIADDAFRDYLFVFGTVIFAQALDDDRLRDSNETISASDVLYYNMAAVGKGGAGHNHSYIIPKRYISGADFLSRATLPNPSNADLHRYAPPWEELRETEKKRGTTIVDDGNVLEIDGIRIGIEICLDHRMGVLWDTLQRQGQQLVDVQLITSAGMAIERGPNPLVPGGVVYLCDGEASSAACIRTDTGRYDPDTVCRERPDGLKHIPHGGPGYSNFFPLAACWDMEHTESLAGYYSRFQTQGCAYTLKQYGINVMEKFRHYPPSVEIYPTVDLPSRS